jgi:hypothetical protein
VITAWPTASAINYGQYLTASNLSGGTASVAGSFAFNDPTLFAGSDAFTFKVNDGTVDSAPATVDIAVDSSLSPIEDAVAAENAAPVALFPTNHSFESPALASGGFQYAPSGAGWTFSSGAGVAANNSPWFAVSAPNGTQACFLQNTGASISQSVDFPTAGIYTLTFSAIGRSGFGSMPTNVRVDGADVLSLTAAQISTSAWTSFTSNPFTVSAGVHTIAFVNGTLSGDHATVIDAVQMLLANSPPVAIAQNITAAPGAPTAITLTGSDPNDDPLTFEIVTQPTYGTLSGTAPKVTYTPQAFPAVGGHDVTVTFTPTDTSNYHRVTGTVSMTVNPATTPYAQWAAEYPDDDLSDPSADNDGDGVTNFGEYAFGLDPTRAASANPFTDITELKRGQFTYTRRASSGLTYTFMTSTDLVIWEPVDATETLGALVDGVQTVLVVLDDEPVEDTFFLRIQAK